MSSLNLHIPHSLPKEEALQRIKQLLGNLREEKKDLISNVREKWEGHEGDFSFSAKGFDLAGKIQVADNGVNINSSLPFALSFFKGMISDVITRKANELLK